jgi:hypothetical protein
VLQWWIAGNYINTAAQRVLPASATLGSLRPSTSPRELSSCSPTRASFLPEARARTTPAPS